MTSYDFKSEYGFRYYIQLFESEYDKRYQLLYDQRYQLVIERDSSMWRYHKGVGLEFLIGDYNKYTHDAIWNYLEAI